MESRWFLVALVITFLTSCTPVAVKDKLTCEKPVVNSYSSKSDNLKVVIYVDGSGSMLGYVKDRKSNYIKALNAIRNVFELTDKLPVEYYRIGNPNQKITGSEYYSYTGVPVFYDGSNAKFKGVSSPIDAAIIAPAKDENKMTVIVTDLEQNSGDVTKLNKKIQDAYFNEDRKDYAVGIWAIKSEFNGSVYVEELNTLKTFAYNSGNQPEKFRPFYILFLGPYNDIQYYFEQLQKFDSQQLIANSNLIIFYPEKIIQNISTLETLPGSVPKWVTRPISLIKDGVSVTKDNTPSELLQIDNRQKENFTIDYSVPFSPAQYSLFLDTDKNSITSNVEVEKFDQFDKKFKAVNSSDINNLIKLVNWQIIDKSQLKFSAFIEPSKFPNPGVYKFKFDIFTQRLQAPIWWKEWDWQARSDDGDGSKTHNLEEFLIGLKNRTETLQTGKSNKSEGNNWLIGSFCYGIQKN